MKEKEQKSVLEMDKEDEKNFKNALEAAIAILEDGRPYQVYPDESIATTGAIRGLRSVQDFIHQRDDDEVSLGELEGDDYFDLLFAMGEGNTRIDFETEKIE